MLTTKVVKENRISPNVTFAEMEKGRLYKYAGSIGKLATENPLFFYTKIKGGNGEPALLAIGTGSYETQICTSTAGLYAPVGEVTLELAFTE